MSHAASPTSASDVSTSSEISGPGIWFWPYSYAGDFPSSFVLYIFSVRIRKFATNLIAWQTLILSCCGCVYVDR